jgi:hypothetical protein
VIYEKDESMVFRRIQDETILVPVRSNVGDLDNIYVLNEVGARIWELIDGEKDAAEIVDAILSEYEIAPEEAERDIAGFLKGLESVGAVRAR